MWISGIVCGPAVLFLTYIQGDLKKTIEFPYLYSPGFQVQMKNIEIMLSPKLFVYYPFGLCL